MFGGDRQLMRPSPIHVATAPRNFAPRHVRSVSRSASGSPTVHSDGAWGAPSNHKWPAEGEGKDYPLAAEMLSKLLGGPQGKPASPIRLPDSSCSKSSYRRSNSAPGCVSEADPAPRSPGLPAAWEDCDLFGRSAGIQSRAGASRPSSAPCGAINLRMKQSLLHLVSDAWEVEQTCKVRRRSTMSRLRRSMSNGDMSPKAPSGRRRSSFR